MHHTIAGSTDVGRVREGNEDSYLIDGRLGLALVADGMGGHACGEVASDIASRTFREALAVNASVLEKYAAGDDGVSISDVLVLMKRAMLSACATVFAEAERDPAKAGMGTTVSALVIAGETAFIAHVGDSRIYLVREGTCFQLTRDHSLLNELVDRGRLTADEANDAAYAGYRNALSRAVGVCSEVEVDTLAIEALYGDTFVLGTDGLTHYLSDGELPAAAEMAPEAIPGVMIELANRRGGHDNITAVVMRLTPQPEELEAGARRSDEFRRKLVAFQAVPMFEDLAPSQLLHVLCLAQSVRMDAGDVVVREGERGDSLYALVDGLVRVERGGELVAELGPGAHFGELSIIDDAPRSATATVVEPAQLLRLRRDDLAEIMGRQPNIALRLLWSLAEVVAQRLRRTTAEMIALRADGEAETVPVGEPPAG